MCSISRHSVSAFTLIEVLVVVAIIALLVGVLIPSLSQARDQAQAVVCKTRLRELYNGHNLYAADSKKNRFPHWDWWLWDGLAGTAERQVVFTPNLYARTGGVRPTDSSRWVEFGQIFRYVRQKETYFCPRDSLRRGIGGIGGGGNNGSKPIHSYVRFVEPHDYALRHDKRSSSAYVDDGVLTDADFLSPDRLRPNAFVPPLNNSPASGGPYTTTPDRVALMYEEWPGADERLAGIPQVNDYQLNDGVSGFTRWVDAMATRHRRQGNFIYWDGHTRLVDGIRYNNPNSDRFQWNVVMGGPR